MGIYTVEKFFLNEQFYIDLSFGLCSKTSFFCFSLLLSVTVLFSKTRELFSLEDQCVLLYFVVKVNGDQEGTRHFGSDILCNMEKMSPMYR